MGERVLVLPAGSGAARLDRRLAEGWPDLSRSRIQALVRAGRVSVDGQTVRDPSATGSPGASVRLDEPEPVEARPVPEPIPLAVVHEDAEIIVIDKPAGLVVHPGAGHERGTLVNALLAHCGDSLSGIGGVRRPGIVHRLDKDTSGLLVVAKTDRAHRALAAQFADHGRSGPLVRAYLALVWGVPAPRAGTIATSLARSTGDREKIAVVAEGRGRAAITHYVVEEMLADATGQPVASLVRCRLETGRTHQIRVHLAHLRHPLLGDPSYGTGFQTKSARLGAGARSRLAGLRRQALHAAVLGFAHPVDGRPMHFESPMPEDLAGLLEALRIDGASAADGTKRRPGALSPGIR